MLHIHICKTEILYPVVYDMKIRIHVHLCELFKIKTSILARAIITRIIEDIESDNIEFIIPHRSYNPNSKISNLE